jgi:tetratricopeptide (TPR) repeat protein
VPAKKKKITRKAIKEDKLVTSFYKVQEFYLKYQKQILIGAGTVAIIILAFVIYSNKIQQENQDASLALSRIMPSYNAKNYKEAIEGKAGTNIIGLKQIVENYGSSEQGESAKIFLAHSYFMLGKYDDALKYYEDYSGSIDLLRSTAYAGAAACYEAKGDLEKAADLFRDAAFVTKSNPQNANYLLDAGLDYHRLGKNDKAKEYFKIIKKDYKKTEVGRKIENYLAIVD